MSLSDQGHFFLKLKVKRPVNQDIGSGLMCGWLLLLLLLPFGMSAQETDRKIRILGKFEGRNAFVRTHHASFLGVRLGVEFKFPIRTGIGYYWMQTHIDSQLFDPSEYQNSGSSATPRMRYAMAYVEYTFWEEDGWSLGVPLQLGFGETFYRTDTEVHVANGFVMPLESGMEVSYRFIRWAGLGVGLGYRLILVNSSGVKESFNSPYYQVRVQLALNELFSRERKD
jgi:hypothetical protein